MRHRNYLLFTGFLLHFHRLLVRITSSPFSWLQCTQCAFLRPQNGLHGYSRASRALRSIASIIIWSKVSTSPFFDFTPLELVIFQLETLSVLFCLANCSNTTFGYRAQELNTIILSRILDQATSLLATSRSHAPSCGPPQWHTKLPRVAQRLTNRGT